MSDLPVATAETAVASPASAPEVDGAAVVESVVSSVQAHPDVHPSRAASVIASVLAGLAEAQPSIFAVTRAGARTQAGVSLGLGLAEILVSALLQRPR
jgi:hypothetical protein